MTAAVFVLLFCLVPLVLLAASLVPTPHLSWRARRHPGDATRPDA